MSKIHVFASFDLEHDGDLYALLLAQSLEPASAFAISGSSQPRTLGDLPDEVLRDALRRADEVVVICGEHTNVSLRMSAELVIAQEEDRPYFLLWGRRASMCTKPATAKHADSMYSWTPGILQDRLLSTLHRGDLRGSRVAAAKVEPDPKT